MMVHSPGPWKVELLPGMGDRRHVMSGDWIVGTVDKGTPDPSANEALILAAPDLLAEAKEVRALADPCPDDDIDAVLAAMRSRLDRVISKAEGGGEP